MIKSIRCAELVELADTQDLGSCVARRVGSSPTFRIVKGIFGFSKMPFSLSCFTVNDKIKMQG